MKPYLYLYLNIMRPSMKPALYQDLFPTDVDLFTKNAFLIMKLSRFPTFRAIRAPIASQLTFEK